MNLQRSTRHMHEDQLGHCQPRIEELQKCHQNWRGEGGQSNKDKLEGGHTEPDGSSNDGTPVLRGYSASLWRDSGLGSMQRRHLVGEDYSDYSESSESSGMREGRGTKLKESKAVKAKQEFDSSETRKRRERQKREWERKHEREQREQQGLKGHYILVDFQGIPYGFGVGAWRRELNRLCASLDPLVTNIHYQQEEHMATLRRRLKENFEYSAPVDREYIRKLTGKSVTQRRSRLLSLMNAGGGPPTGVDENVWRRLDHIRQDPSREYLSQRMKHANASKINKGCMGPKGEEGIKDELYRMLGRDPDLEEVRREMRRDKGYASVLQKRRAARCKQMPITSDSGDDSEEKEIDEKATDAAEGTPKLKRRRRNEVIEEFVYEASYVRGMEDELRILQARIAGGTMSCTPTAAETAGPLNSTFGSREAGEDEIPS